jgi:hypothetical protein
VGVTARTTVGSEGASAATMQIAAARASVITICKRAELKRGSG